MTRLNSVPHFHRYLPPLHPRIDLPPLADPPVCLHQRCRSPPLTNLATSAGPLVSPFLMPEQQFGQSLDAALGPGPPSADLTSYFRFFDVANLINNPKRA